MAYVHAPAFADTQFRLIQGTVPVPPLTVIQDMTATIRHFDPLHLLSEVLVDPFAKVPRESFRE
jgi:hypothetical protein